MAEPAGPKSNAGSGEKASDDTPSRMGRFIQTYSGFLSSFVIGVAGLVATSIWQYRQSQIAQKQAESEQAIAKTKAENDWRIARADILAKNLNVLASQTPDTADQRFGVLLSLTRGSILDPELAVSYALELGRVRPEYMRSVLASTAHKNYVQLAHAFALTCLQRFGVERAAEICKDDQLADRSDAIAQLIQDELEAAAATANAGAGPLTLLKEERDVQAQPGKLMWLFEPYLQDLYERRQWNEIGAFESYSVGARLVAALVLATARTGEFITDVEHAQLDKFHAARRKWLVSYMFGRSCDPECRGKLVDQMLSTYGEAQGDYDEALKKLIQLSRGEAGPALSRLHARLLWCQVDADDLAQFRDRVLVPALASALGNGKADRTMLEDLVGLLALVPEPVANVPAPAVPLVGPAAHVSSRAPASEQSVRAWRQVVELMPRSGDRLQRAFNVRRATARRERLNPPPMIRKVNLCNVAESEGATPAFEP